MCVIMIRDEDMFEYRGEKIHYIRYGNSNGKSLVFLHGWGQNIEMMKMVGDYFSEQDVIIIDLPGHGRSEEPKEVLTLYDITDMVHSLLEELGVDNPIFIGHSFGGKISLIYASKYNIQKLILFGSPFKVKKNPNSLKVRFLKKVKGLPFMGKLSEFAKKHMGSNDYRSASKIMREILVKHVNEDITDLVKKIKCPTIIVWGDRDCDVPISDAYELSSYINDSAVIVYDGCTHYAYLERLGQTVNIISSFIGDGSDE